jgi:sortase A
MAGEKPADRVPTASAIGASATLGRTRLGRLTTEAAKTGVPGSRPRRPPQRVTVTGVIGELLITAGVVVMLFLGWYIWLNDIVAGNEQQQAAEVVQQELQDRWERGEASQEREPVDPGEPVVAAPAEPGEVFGTLIVPRFGDDYVRPIAGGVDLRTVLNNRQIGIGHYLDTQMPGEIGNFAVAAHRTTYGAPFANIAELRFGDKIYVETADGWYQYAFRGLEYVWPTRTEVLEPVPQAPDLEPTDRILTMTSCNPKFSSAERIIAYAVMETWYPRAGGPPAELAGVVEAAGR